VGAAAANPAGPAAAGQGAGPAGTGAAIPVAFTGRTSTLALQDPVASLRRQARRECQEKLPPGMFIAAWYWDIESGGMDIDQRGHSTSYEQFTGQIGIPRDGGLADLLKEAGSPAPRFAAVICEDIERSGRDTFYALKLEKELTLAGIPLFATDEPIDIAGANATTVLVRRMKQGVAEWFRLQIKEKAWKGLPAIAARLNANPQRYPPPGTSPGWSPQAVYKILGNPKYTGYMVYGRTRTINGRERHVPQSEWIWSPQPTHPPIVSRPVWDAAQTAGAAHSTSRDSLEPNTHPQTRRSYLFRSRIRCRDCKRRMCGESPRPEDIYYGCPHSPKNPCDVHKYPGHPHRVSVREDRLAAVVAQFCDTYLFGTHRAAYLARMFPATAATATKRRATKTTALHKRLTQIDAAENAHAREIETLAHLGNPQAPAVIALRSRTLARFTELEDERAHIKQQLHTLARQDEDPQQDPTLLDILPRLDPATLATAPQDTPTSHTPDSHTPDDPTRTVFINRPIGRANKSQQPASPSTPRRLVIEWTTQL
jgi:Recombinase/Resolvase, N terminal domain